MTLNSTSVRLAALEATQEDIIAYLYEISDAMQTAHGSVANAHKKREWRLTKHKDS